MTVSTTIDRYQYLGNGVTTSFPFPVVFLAPADIGVALMNGNTKVSANLNGGGTYDYTVAGTQDPATGEYLGGAAVVVNTAPPTGYTLTLWRNEPLTQNVIFSPNTSLPAPVLNTALDKATMIDQYLNDNLVRSIRAPWTDPPPNSNPTMVLPPVATRAGQLVSFDSSGNVIVVPPGGSFSSGNFLANMAALRATTGTAGSQAVLTGYTNAGDKPMVLYTWNAGDSRADDGGLVILPTGHVGAGRWNLDVGGGPYKVLDWGADPTGATASDAAFNASRAAAIANNAAWDIGAGHFKLASQQYWDLTGAANGLRVLAAGFGATILDFSGVATIPALLIGGSPSSGYFKFNNDPLNVRGSVAGQLVQVGHEDFSDPLNGSTINLWINQNNTSASACAIELNELVTCTGFIVADCSGHGDAMRMRQVIECVFGGSQSNADIGHHFTTGYNYGNTFLAVDLEVVGTCVQSDSANASKNTYVGGQFVASVAEVTINAGSNYFRFIGTNPSNSYPPRVTGAGKGAVIWEDGFTGTSPFGGVLIQPRAGDAAAVVSAVPGNQAEITFQQQNTPGVGTTRWNFAKNNATESGSNVGSDLIVTRYNDAGASIDNPIAVNRATGIVTFQDGLAAPLGALFGFFGVTPAAQPNAGHGFNPGTAGSTTAAFTNTAWDGGIGASEYTVFDVVRALKLLGLIAA